MKKILLLLSDGFEALEASAFTDVFGWNQTIGDRNITLTTASLRNPISSTWNFKVTTEKLLEEVIPEEYDALVISGGFGQAGFFKDTKSPCFRKTIIHFHEHNKLIAGVCTGVIPLAESGILEGMKATTYLMDNDRYFGQLERWGAEPVRESIVIDGSIITSSAPATSIEVAFILLELLSSSENADYIRKNMGYS